MELILTSAQNLTDAKGNEVEDLQIFDLNQRKLEIVAQWYCPAYRRSRKPEYDFAAIKVKRTTAVFEGRGFGFSMCLGDQNVCRGGWVLQDTIIVIARVPAVSRQFQWVLCSQPSEKKRNSLNMVLQQMTD